MTKPQRILIVADDEAQRELIRRTLEERGFAVATATDGSGAAEALLESRFDLIVISLARTADGVALIEQVRSRPKSANTLLLVLAEWGTGQATLALAQGADAFEPAPIDASRLIASIEELFHQKAVVAERGI